MENMGPVESQRHSLYSCCIMAFLLRYLIDLKGTLCLTNLWQAAIMVTERVNFITSGSYAERLRTSNDELLSLPLAVASYALSLATNGVSTLMIAYKAWCVMLSANRLSCS
jgi:hypothetical protein